VCLRKQLWSDFSYHPCIFTEGMKKITKILIQDYFLPEIRTEQFSNSRHKHYCLQTNSSVIVFLTVRLSTTEQGRVPHSVYRYKKQGLNYVRIRVCTTLQNNTTLIQGDFLARDPKLLSTCKYSTSLSIN